ncbi:MAG: acyl-CoA synthetase [Verrucomicrobiales bacterium]|nr:acyl-CoA synthetase [Verrucomicrobiales bacterium]
MKELELITQARSHREQIAVRTELAKHTYADLLVRSEILAATLLDEIDDLAEARIAFLIPAGFEYVATQWAVWRAGGVTVPLCLSAAEPELEYTLSDCQASQLVVASAYKEKVEALCEKLSVSLLVIEEINEVAQKVLPGITPDRAAMILYTSGTTSNPKGVVATHANIQAQIESLSEAWEWSPNDRIPLFLPLHHIHGIINICSCALWVGATIEPFPHFDLEKILGRVRTGAYTVFMAVPTIYVKLIKAIESMPEDERSATVGGFSKMRLMVSGSAALPASIHEKWTALTGQKLLERYGMTELGMALSNPYHGERRPGAVGVALPKVDVRLKSEQGELITVEDEPGEIQVRGPAVFHEYWNRPQITEESFDEGWFRTGDMAVIESGYFRIMGRLSIDIIKSGGYKLSGLEIEAALLQHEAISECAVIGVPDETWGEMVVVAAVLEAGVDLEIDSLREWCRDRLSTYKIPKRLLVVEALPRNAMGKVTKMVLRELF